MAKQKGLHKSDKEQYASYKIKCTRDKNRTLRLACHLKDHPNDTQAENACAVKPFKVKPHTKGNYPDQKHYVYDGAGQKTLASNHIPPKVGVKKAA